MKKQKVCSVCEGTKFKVKKKKVTSYMPGSYLTKKETILMDVCLGCGRESQHREDLFKYTKEKKSENGKQ